MTAVHRDLTVEQGVTFSAAWTVQLDGVPLDPADGWQARSQVRTAKADADVLHQFDCAVDGPVVQLSVQAEDSSAWTWRRGVYDVEVFNPAGRVIRLVEGTVVVSAEVTR